MSSAVLGAMVEKGLFEPYKKEISRFETEVYTVQEAAPLSDAQQVAYRQISDSFKEHSVTLLHGVTSSGKTEIYAHLIDRVLHEGRQVLYLVPEIALTTQLTNRLRKIFGDKLMIYHSKFSDNERVEIWNTLLDDHSPRIVLGVRSSIFLPVRRFGIGNCRRGTMKLRISSTTRLPVIMLVTLRSFWLRCMGLRLCWERLPRLSKLISMRGRGNMVW